ncbi:MAG TPA: DUF427 domain-containing protein [bacterium]|jgi:uncharacterized protein (DUF427 family)
MPYIDLRQTENHVEVYVGGIKVAETRRPWVMKEGPLPTRYYIPIDDVNMEYLKRTETKSHCPIKGDATYWSVVVDGKEYEDVVWEYREPIDGVKEIKGTVCFWNEKVERIVVDGEEF